MLQVTMAAAGPDSTTLPRRGRGPSLGAPRASTTIGVLQTASPQSRRAGERQDQIAQGDGVQVVEHK